MVVVMEERATEAQIEKGLVASYVDAGMDVQPVHGRHSHRARW